MKWKMYTKNPRSHGPNSKNVHYLCIPTAELRKRHHQPESIGPVVLGLTGMTTHMSIRIMWYQFFTCKHQMCESTHSDYLQ